MDLVLLEPGDSAFFGNLSSPPPAWAKKVPPDFAAVNVTRSIELVSVQHGLKQQVATDPTNTARTSGRPAITELTCVKHLDPTSVRFNEYCLRALPLGAGAAQPTLVHLLRDSGEQLVPFLKLSLRDAIITEVQMQTQPDGMPTEQFKLNFTEILWTYTLQGSDGRPSGAVSAGWSLARNRPIAQFT